MIGFITTTVSLLSTTSVFRSLRPFHSIIHIHIPIRMGATGIRMAAIDPSKIARNDASGATRDYRP
jgi:hypothetical protein